MSTFTSVTTASYRYYDKRNRRVAEDNIRHMARVLHMDAPTGLAEKSKPELIQLALWFHSKMLED